MSELWYFTSEGKQMEPVTNAELKQLASSGFLRPGDMVWKEGMAQWVKASTVAGLFPAGASRGATGISAKENAAPVRSSPSRPSKVERDPVEERPRRRRRDEDEVDDEDVDRTSDEDRPKRRRKAKAGMSGLTIGLIIGGAVVGLFLVCGGIVFIATRGGRGGAVNINDPNNFSVNLNAGQFHSRDITFNAGTLYEISVRCDTRERRGRTCDVDCIIENQMGQWLSGDDTVGPDSLVRFSPAVTGVYKLKVENLDPQTSNRANVVIRNAGVSNGPVSMMPQFPRPDRPVAFMNPIPNPNNFPKLPVGGAPMTTDPPVPLNAGQNFEKTVTYPQGKVVTVRVTSFPQINDVDLFVTDQNGRDLGLDVRVSPDCLVTFTAQANTAYRFRINNLGPQLATCTLSYTRP